jgi:hypothetical protein
VATEATREAVTLLLMLSSTVPSRWVGSIHCQRRRAPATADCDAPSTAEPFAACALALAALLLVQLSPELSVLPDLDFHEPPDLDFHDKARAEIRDSKLLPSLRSAMASSSSLSHTNGMPLADNGQRDTGDRPAA